MVISTLVAAIAKSIYTRQLPLARVHDISVHEFCVLRSAFINGKVEKQVEIIELIKFFETPVATF